MNVFSCPDDFEDLIRGLPDFDNHEEVVFAQDEESGLQVLLAVHNLSRGPGTGGTRLWNYDSLEEAATDALRLSMGMTYKNALAELPFGGGKAVIWSPGEIRNRRELMLAFGRAVDSLDGRYCTAEDVGTSTEDMAIVSETTSHIFGLGNTSGDPSPYTAQGVLMGMEESVKVALKTDDLQGVRVLVQGAGHVGYHLCELLYERGAKIYVSDINPRAVARCEQDFGVEGVAVDRVFETEVDVYSPCALGATVREDTLSKLTCRVIAGAANNQLQSDTLAEALEEKGVLYAPDYLINAGGIINISCEVSQTYDSKLAIEKVAGIRFRMQEVLRRSKQEGKTTVAVAKEMAREKFTEGKSSRVEMRTVSRALPIC